MSNEATGKFSSCSLLPDLKSTPLLIASPEGIGAPFHMPPRPRQCCYAESTVKTNRPPRSTAIAGPQSGEDDRNAGWAETLSPSGPSRNCRMPMTDNSQKWQQWRGEIGHRHPDDRAGEQQRRVAQLRIGRARRPCGECHRCADRAAGSSRAPSGRARSGPPPSAPRRARNRRSARREWPTSRRPFQRRRSTSMQPPAAAASCIDARPHPGERVQHLEKEHEGRNQRSLGEALAVELCHQRGQDAYPPTASARDEAVSERRANSRYPHLSTEVLGWVGQGCSSVGYALLHGPDLPGPARR